ncbi:hypothetical protein ABZP36_007039 [Zizania latifolia]
MYQPFTISFMLYSSTKHFDAYILPSCPENTVPTYTLLVQDKMPKSHKHQITNQKRNVLINIYSTRIISKDGSSSLKTIRLFREYSTRSNPHRSQHLINHLQKS